MTKRKEREVRLSRYSAGAIVFATFFAVWTADAPAAESRHWPQATWYTVIARRGDTLSELAARYDVSAAAVARLNRLELRSEIVRGEMLRIPAGSRATREAVLSDALGLTVPNYAPPPKSSGVASYIQPRDRVSVGDLTSPESSAVVAATITSVPQDQPSFAPTPQFVWPVTGPVISPFGPDGDGGRNDGINVAVALGAPIHAAAAGTISYAGDGLKDYGNLILIVHPRGYVTAYAHAQSIAVSRGQHVEKGQVIGTAGETGAVDRPQLHFEIRRGVKPVNPGLLLAAAR
ncbi:MAG: peptidoglycan DD-metalloendopeptidase family protein [Rhizomicrobium sp.]